MAKYTQNGSNFMVGKDADFIIHEDLPAGTYTVAVDPMKGFYLTTSSDFTLPPKVYGKSPRHALRMIDTFMARPNATGVHLDGVKGSGKTLLVKSICIEAQKQGIPTIMINEPYCGDAFNSFMQSIDTPAIVVFDEFEKTYNTEEQTKVLTLFDGVYPSKKMFLLTTNESWRVSDFLKNRPGRMYYSLKFDVIEAGVVEEYLNDNLNNKGHIENIIKYSQVFTFLNFDMLAAIVEEMNRYDESLNDVLSILNVKPEMKQNEQYNIWLKIGDNEFIEIDDTNEFDPNRWNYWCSRYDICQALGIDDDGDDVDSDLDSLLSGSTAVPDGQSQPRQSSGNSALKNGFSVDSTHLTTFNGMRGEFIYNKTESGHVIEVKVVRENRQLGANGVFNYNAI